MCENIHKKINSKEEILPIVNKVIKNYRGKILIEYDDFRSECYLSALEGADKWEKSDRKASLLSWVWIYVSGRIKDFSKKETVFMISFNDALQLPISINNNNADEICIEAICRVKKNTIITPHQLMDVLFPQMPTFQKIISRQRIHQIQGKAQELLVGLGKQ